MPESLLPSPFQIDHIIAEQHGGETAPRNLAIACFHCNLHKGPNLAGIDPVSRRMTRLFHPRKDRWEEHFRWKQDVIIGITAVGRTTIAVLDMNNAINVRLRESGRKE